MSQTISKPNLAKKYILNKPILYSNIEYMDFFNNYFTEYINICSNSIKNKDLCYLINSSENFLSLSDILREDTILRDETLREFVILQNLKDLYFNPNYNKKNIIKILAQLSKESKNYNHRLIAKNLIKTLTNLCQGAKAPDFILKDTNNKNISLSNFKGKYVYLNFWTKYSKFYKVDLELISELFNKYNDKIEFISISTDRISIELEENYKWTFLNSFHNNELIKNYELKSHPLYVFIDDKGNIVQYPAKAPDENIEFYFKKIIR